MSVEFILNDRGPVRSRIQLLGAWEAAQQHSLAMPINSGEIDRLFQIIKAHQMGEVPSELSEGEARDVAHG